MACLRSIAVAGLLSLNFFAPSANAQEFGPDHVVIPFAYANAPIGFLAPIYTCYSQDPRSVIGSAAFQQIGTVVTLTVHVVPTSCFSAGDAPVEKAVRFTMAPLPKGSYTLHYRRFEGATNDELSDDEVVAFDVAEGAASIPALTGLSLLLLAGMLLCVGCRLQHAARS